MRERKEFKLSEEELQGLMDACRSEPMIALQCGMPRSPQENANAAWAVLGKKWGFDPMTVKPVPGKSNKHFTAEEVEGR